MDEKTLHDEVCLGEALEYHGVTIPSANRLKKLKEGDIVGVVGIIKIFTVVRDILRNGVIIAEIIPNRHHKLPREPHLKIGDLIQYEKKHITDFIPDGFKGLHWFFGLHALYLDGVIHLFPKNDKEEPNYQFNYQFHCEKVIHPVSVFNSIYKKGKTKLIEYVLYENN